MLGRKNEDKETLVKDSIIDITQENESDKVIASIMDTLFSSNSDKIIQSADYDRDGLQDIYIVETFLALKLFKYGTFDMVVKYRMLVDRLLQATVSLDRKGRQELFEALRPQPTFLSNEDMGRRRGLFRK